MPKDVRHPSQPERQGQYEQGQQRNVGQHRNIRPCGQNGTADFRAYCSSWHSWRMGEYRANSLLSSMARTVKDSGSLSRRAVAPRPVVYDAQY